MAQLIVLQLLQMLTVLAMAPRLPGVINRLKAIVQSRRGPSILQPSYDLRELLHKGSVVAEHASWLFHLAPLVPFITPLVVAMKWRRESSTDGARARCGWSPQAAR
jgi:formate hydrogenlyase subunit 4